jgi:two-component system sensor histidine kinase KdpD
MKISQRLFLGVIPSVVGLFTVAGLAYWGQYHHTAPEMVVWAAGAATVISLVVAWRETRYVAHRVERLASAKAGAPDGEVDELDVIEQRVELLGEAATAAKADAARAAEDAGRRNIEYATLLAEAATSASKQLAEARLSLHVLQDNHFGELNDNQEEMIGAAREATEAAEVELNHLREIADIDRGALSLRRDLVKPGEIIRSLLPLLNAQATKQGVRILSELEPALPRVVGDRGRLQDALGLILKDAVRYAVPGTSVSIHASSQPATVTIVVNHSSPHSYTGDVALADRLIRAQGGSVTHTGDATTIALERAGVRSSA